MRKIKIVKIDDREITVKELRVKDIREIITLGETAGENIPEDIEKLLPYAVDIKPEDLEEMAPSEIKVLWEGFAEVNADFLGVIEQLGIVKMFKSSILKFLTAAFADLSKTDTQMSGNTDGVSSCGH